MNLKDANKNRIDYKGVSAVYVFSNTITGKSYIGSTNNLMIRLKQHFYIKGIYKGSNTILNDAFVKTPIQLWSINIVRTEKEELRDLEKSLIVITGLENLYNKNLPKITDEQRKEKSKEYRSKNAVKIAKQKYEYRANNIEKFQEYDRQKYLKKKEKENKEKINSYLTINEIYDEVNKEKGSK